MKLPRPGTAAERDTLLRQKLNRAFAQTDGIALALLGELDDLPSNDLGYGVGSINQAQRAQGVFERSGEDRYLVRSKYMIFQQRRIGTANGSRCVCSFCSAGAGSLPIIASHSRPIDVATLMVLHGGRRYACRHRRRAVPIPTSFAADSGPWVSDDPTFRLDLSPALAGLFLWVDSTALAP